MKKHAQNSPRVLFTIVLLAAAVSLGAGMSVLKDKEPKTPKPWTGAVDSKVNVAVPKLEGQVVLQDDPTAVVDPTLIVGAIYEHEESDGVGFEFGVEYYYKDDNSLTLAADSETKYYSIVNSKMGANASALFGEFNVDADLAREIRLDRRNFAAIKLGGVDYKKLGGYIKSLKASGRTLSKYYLIRGVYVYEVLFKDYKKVDAKAQVNQGIAAIGLSGGVYASASSDRMNKSYYTVLNLIRLDNIEPNIAALETGKPEGAVMSVGLLDQGDVVPGIKGNLKLTQAIMVKHRINKRN
jgi:hypothetical protein